MSLQEVKILTEPLLLLDHVTLQIEHCLKTNIIISIHTQSLLVPVISRVWMLLIFLLPQQKLLPFSPKCLAVALARTEIRFRSDYSWIPVPGETFMENRPLVEKLSGFGVCFNITATFPMQPNGLFTAFNAPG